MGFTIVLGLGKSGIAAALLLKHQGKQVAVLEEKNSIYLRNIASDLSNKGLAIRLGVPFNYASLEEFFPLVRVVISPGIPWNHPILSYCRKENIPITGDVTLAWEIYGQIPWIAITGTNGKTTVTHLVNHMLSYAGLDAPMCGNIGKPINELILSRQHVDCGAPDYLVVELSSYQIEAAPALQPHLALWTTLTPDHLDRHETLVNYRSIKRSLLERATCQILNGNDSDLYESAHSWPYATWITTDSTITLANNIRPKVWIEEGQVTTKKGRLFSTECLAMLGDHNKQNLLLATAVGLHIELDPCLMEQAFRCFPGVPHRLELIVSCQGISFYNDSKATNFDAAESGIKAIGKPMVVIAGGQAKSGSPQRWIDQLRLHARAVILFGEAQERFIQLLEQGQYQGKVYCCSNLQQAVPLSLTTAIEYECAIVLLSPACASFDQYKNFEARGNDFRERVKALDTTISNNNRLI